MKKSSWPSWTQGRQSHNTVCWQEKEFDQSNFKVETDLYNCHHIIILTITIVIIIILSLLQLSKGFQKRRKLPRPWERWWASSSSAGFPSLSPTSLVRSSSLLSPSSLSNIKPDHDFHYMMMMNIIIIIPFIINTKLIIPVGLCPSCISQPDLTLAVLTWLGWINSRSLSWSLS